MVVGEDQRVAHRPVRRRTRRRARRRRSSTAAPQRAARPRPARGPRTPAPARRADLRGGRLLLVAPQQRHPADPGEQGPRHEGDGGAGPETGHASKVGCRLRRGPDDRDRRALRRSSSPTRRGRSSTPTPKPKAADAARSCGARATTTSPPSRRSTRPRRRGSSPRPRSGGPPATTPASAGSPARPSSAAGGCPPSYDRVVRRHRGRVRDPARRRSSASGSAWSRRRSSPTPPTP